MPRFMPEIHAGITAAHCLLDWYTRVGQGPTAHLEANIDNLLGADEALIDTLDPTYTQFVSTVRDTEMAE